MKCLKKVITFRRNFKNELIKPSEFMSHDHVKCSVRSYVGIKTFSLLFPLKNEIKNELKRKIMHEFI